jgi:hypothetical protein
MRGINLGYIFMKTYKVKLPFIPSMGSINPFIVRESAMETKEQAALWEINSMRRHDGLREYTDWEEFMDKNNLDFNSVKFEELVEIDTTSNLD